MKMTFLTAENIDLLADFESRARLSEPDIFITDFDKDAFLSQTRSALDNPFYNSARCLMCVDGEAGVVGRLDFTLLPSFVFGGELRAYVDWVYVLKEYRHRGIAQSLFAEMEIYLKAMGINEYFLLAAENEEAQKFYNGFKNVKIDKQDTITKTF